MMTAIVAWILLSDRTERTVDHDEDTGLVMVAVLLLPVIATLGLPYFAWTATRDAGGDRWTAVMVVAMVLAIVLAVAVLEGPWWALAVALALGGLSILVVWRVNWKRAHGD